MGNRGSCKAANCGGEVVGKGYCRRHYRLWKRGQMPKPRFKTCRAPGCRKRQVRGARCEEHQRARAASTAGGGAAAAATPPAAG